MCHWSLQILAIKLLPTTTISRIVSWPLIWEKFLGKPVYWTIFLEMFRSHCQHLPPSEICLVVSWTICLMYFTIFRPYLPQKRFVSWAKETNFLVGSWMYIVDQLHPITKYVSWSHELMSHGTLSCDDLVINCTYCYYLASTNPKNFDLNKNLNMNLIWIEIESLNLKLRL